MQPQRSVLAGTFAGALQPYIQATFLENGYRFFAPEPGPSHLIRYEMVFDDGSRSKGFFPNRQEARPRLLYHRYFMMSEFMNTLEEALQGAQREPNVPPDQLRRLRELTEAYAQSYAKHLWREHRAREVKLYLRTHYVPRVQEVQNGTRLDDPALYEERLIGVYDGARS
jgi:hypothetical protein